jgi:7-cyano-7-deazaguanine synthase in queuosine biosynthesis
MVAECLYQTRSHYYRIQLQLFNYQVPTMAFARTAVHQTLAQQHQIHNHTVFIVANIALTGSWPCSSPTRHINNAKAYLFY